MSELEIKRVETFIVDGKHFNTKAEAAGYLAVQEHTEWLYEYISNKWPEKTDKGIKRAMTDLTVHLVAYEAHRYTESLGEED